MASSGHVSAIFPTKMTHLTPYTMCYEHNRRGQRTSPCFPWAVTIGTLCIAVPLVTFVTCMFAVWMPLIQRTTEYDEGVCDLSIAAETPPYKCVTYEYRTCSTAPSPWCTQISFDVARNHPMYCYKSGEEQQCTGRRQHRTCCHRLYKVVASTECRDYVVVAAMRDTTLTAHYRTIRCRGTTDQVDKCVADVRQMKTVKCYEYDGRIEYDSYDYMSDGFGLFIVVGAPIVVGCVVTGVLCLLCAVDVHVAGVRRSAIAYRCGE
jgi:hypothetical protein